MESVTPENNIVSLLAQDHAAVKDRLSEFDLASPESRDELFWTLTDQLVRHEVGEEVVVYPALKDLPGGSEVVEARLAEEAEAEKLLAAMEKMEPSTDEFMTALRELRSAVLEHARHEETEVFPLLLAHEEAGRLEYLGQKFKGAKLAAPNRPHPHLPSGPMSQKTIGPIAAFFDRMREGARADAARS
jgi:hemerythrin superfamily protein